MPSPFTTSHSRLVSARPEAVMALVRDPSTWPQWQSEVRSATGSQGVGMGDVVDGTAQMLGFDVHGHSTITAVSGGHLEQDVVIGVRMRVTFTVKEDGGGTVVTHHVRADLPRGPAGRLLSLFLRRRLVRMQRLTLARLAGQLEG